MHVKARAILRKVRRVPKRFVVYGVLGVVGICYAVWDGPKPREFNLRGGPAEMGRDYGRGSKHSVRLLCRVYVKGFICRNDDSVYASRCRKAMTLWDCIAAPYQEEIAALAAATGVDRAAVVLGNSFIDLGYSAYGCRAVAVETSGGLLHAHNLDWDSVGGLAKWTISIVRRAPDDGRYRTVSVCLPGMVGALDIVNEHGLALSVNQIGYGNGDPVEPVFLKVRRIAETCRTFAEAREQILASSCNMPFILTVSSAPERSSAVFEPMGRRISVRMSRSGRVAADNVTWGENSSRSGVCRAVHEAPLGTVADMQGLLRSSDVLLACNIYSVIFDYTGRRLLLASGTIPAAEENYREYALFGKPED